MVVTFCCPSCEVRSVGPAWNVHLVAHLDHRSLLFQQFVDDFGLELLDDVACDGRTKVCAAWDDAERMRFGANADGCAPGVVRCSCQNTMCADHTMACMACGRFACLRHRITGLCPECSPTRLRRHVSVPKHDPFTKKTTMVYRSYAAPPPEPWARVCLDPGRQRADDAR